MKRSLFLAGLMTLVATAALAQSPPSTSSTSVDPLTTRLGHQLNLSVQHYEYIEPLEIDVVIHGPKFGGEYTGTFSLNQQRRWYAQFNVRGTGATAAYDGSCRPWQIAPSSTSPNGYRLTLGAASPCAETGDADFYLDGRFVAGKDIVGATVGVSPFIGVGARHLSNGTGGNFNYRTQEYLYVPVGATVRTTAFSGRGLGITVEYDQLLRGWNTTRNSLFPGGLVPATSTTPAFSIGDFADISFTQRKGYAVRASASYEIKRSWTIEPYYVRWHLSDSSIESGSVAYTVNSITARQTLNYREPLNFTNEFGVKIGLHFGGK